MKALVKTECKKGLELCEVAMPTMADDEVLIKVHKMAICGTDLHIYLWDEWSKNTIKPPRVIGHEFCGEIVDLGKNTQGFYKKGDIVTAEGHMIFGNSRSVRTNNIHLAKDTLGLGIHTDGAGAEYVAVPEKNIWQSRYKEITQNTLSIFDPLGNAVHSVLSWDIAGEDVLITGAGPIGLMSVAICNFIGARKVVITDINDYRLNIAKKLGAITVNLQKEKLSDVVAQEEISDGFGIGLEMAGVPSALNDLVEHLMPGGKISLLGILPNKAQGINFTDIIFKGITLKGIYGREMFNTWYKVDALIEKGLNISPIITGNYHYTKYQQAFEQMIQGNAAKLILDWS